jgi:hypothetical protein
MLKMTKKSLLVISLLLCIAGTGLAAYAAFWVNSNPVHVKLDYVVHMEDPPSVSGSEITLRAYVTSNGVTLLSGTISFFEWDGTGYNIHVGDGTIDGTTGWAQYIFDAGGNGDYYFEAFYYAS